MLSFPGARELRTTVIGMVEYDDGLSFVEWILMFWARCGVCGAENEWSHRSGRHVRHMIRQLAPPKRRVEGQITPRQYEREREGNDSKIWHRPSLFVVS
jgi:hypothetical protein